MKQKSISQYQNQINTLPETSVTRSENHEITMTRVNTLRTLVSRILYWET